MKQSALRQLLDNHGCVESREMHDALVADFPSLIVGVKMGCSMRFTAPIKDVDHIIKGRERDNPEDYAREVFLPSSAYDTLRSVLNMGEAP